MTVDTQQMILILYKNFRDKIPTVTHIVTISKANYSPQHIGMGLSDKELGILFRSLSLTLQITLGEVFFDSF